MAIEYDILTHPLPPRFVEWYPYAQPSVMLPDNAHWLDSMQRAIGDRMPGVVHHFSAARDTETDAYVGVAWLGLSPAMPEVAHFGWFLVEEDHRGMGIGREVLDRALGFLDKRGVKIVMLPTRLSTIHARGMYGRRGFVDLIAEQETGKCWMIRGDEKHFDSYFVAHGSVSISPMGYGDWFAFDYLLNHGRVISRLYPVGLTGERRALSLTRASEWGTGIEELAIRRGSRMCGFILIKSDQADFYTPDEELAEEAVRYLTSRAGKARQIVTAARDEMKTAAVRDSGMTQARTFRERPFGRSDEEEFILWRTG